MMFTSSDASSLVRELWWWEHAEYVFGALVAAACAGEYIADFNKRPWVKAHKDRIAKISTLVLVAALVFELICITRANGKSDEVIGKLRDEAEAADNLAQSAVQNSNAALGTSGTALTKSADAITDSSNALSQAKDALTKAGKAADSLGKAEDEANKAQTASSNALTLARGARQEADSFEKDIVSAKERAANAEQETSRLKERMADRVLTDKQVAEIVARLEPYAGQEFEVMAYWNLPETAAIANRVYTALNRAGWKYIPPPPNGGFLAPGWIGIFANVSPNSSDSTKKAASALVLALQEQGLAAKLAETSTIDNKIHLNFTGKP